VKRIAAVAAAVALATVAGWLGVAGGWGPQVAAPAYAMVPPEPVPSTSPTPTPAPTAAAPAGSCASVAHPFDPRTISIPGITKHARVVTPPRIARGVPGSPPLTTAGKELFAWDKQSGVRPGQRAGNVRLNAHVWPNGSAVGNRMLSRLHRGDRIVVHGTKAQLCYQVTSRVEVLASRGLGRYYVKAGKPQLAIVVCSGRRLAPGVWQKRTVWFASPKV
jgi:hypothetical protein